jgi:PilZ domain
MAQIGKKRERRRYSRSPIRKTVPALWEDEAGRELLLQGQLIDVSVSGAKILVPMRLPARSSVSFNCLTLARGRPGEPFEPAQRSDIRRPAERTGTNSTK